jgi:hypothetical protein
MHPHPIHATAAAAAAAPAADPLADLEDLLAESTGLAIARKDLTAGRKSLAAGLLQQAQRAELLAEVQKLELKVEWIAQANVAVFEEQACVCGAPPARLFTGLFRRDRHKNLHTDRWVREAAHKDATLPREVRVMKAHLPVAMCPACVAGHGYGAVQ